MMRLRCESCAMMRVWCVVLWMMDVQVRRKKCDKDGRQMTSKLHREYLTKGYLAELHKKHQKRGVQQVSPVPSQTPV